MRRSGFTRELHSSMHSFAVMRTMPTSVIRSCAALPPVVSRSTNTRSRGSSSSSAASIERQDWVVKVRTAVAEQAPGLAIAPHLLEVETGGQHRLAAAISLGKFLAGMRRNERGAIKRHRVFLACLLAYAVRCDEWHDIRRGMALHRALPVPARV